mgnify:CR=1 FL=1
MLGFYFTSTNETNLSEVDLKPNGSNIVVTDSNKHEFMRLKCHYHAYTACKTQLEQIRKGFHTVIPASWISFLTADELESLMCGQNEIDLADWKANTVT